MPGPDSAIPTGRGARWLSLGPASRLLGIDPDTLRRWADQGRVATWTTPGGHRRFERASIERLATGRRSHGGPLLATLGASPERVARAYRRHYAAGSAMQAGSAVASADETTRAAFRRDGLRLIETLIAYLDRDPRDTDERDRLEEAAQAVVDDQARRLAADGTSLTEAVVGFVAARQPFLDELAGLGRRRSLDPGRLASLYSDASAVLDRLLLRFIDAHQRAGA